jgi:hypothetical protein
MGLDTAFTGIYYTNQLFHLLWPLALTCVVLWWRRGQIPRKWLFLLSGTALAYLVSVISAAVTYPYFAKLGEDIIAGGSPQTMMIASAVLMVVEITLTGVLLVAFAKWLNKRSRAHAS